MAFNPMQQQQSPDMLMAMMTDPRSTPQQRMAAMSALNAMRGGANAPQPPQMTGDSTGVSDMDPAFMAAVRQEMTGQGAEAQPEIAQRQAAPEAPENPATAALMSGAADASRVAAMAQGGAVKGYADGGGLWERLKALLPEPDHTTQDDSSMLQAQGYSLPLDMPLKERMRRKAEGEAYRSQLEMANHLAEQRGVEIPFSLDPSFNAAESTLTKEQMPKPTSLQGFAPPQVSPVDYAPPDFQYGEAPVAAPRAKAAVAAAQALTTPPPAVVEPGKPDPAAEALNARKQEESNAHKERMDKLLGDDQPLSAQDKWMALARAGFATAAGSSPHALQNIGAGLSKGVESLDELRKERAVNRMKQATLLQSQRSEDLSNEARNRQLDISAGGLKVEQANADLKKKEYESAQTPGSLEYQKAQAVINYYKSEAVKNAKPDRATEAEYKYNLLVNKGGLAPQEAARVASGVEKNDDLNKAIALKQAEEAVKTIDADIKNISLKPEALKKLKDQAYNDAYNRAYSILNTNLSTQERGAAPPPAGGGNPALEAALNNYK